MRFSKKKKYFEYVNYFIFVFMVVGYLNCSFPVFINVDFADVWAIMKDDGSSLMGIGTAIGKFKIFSFDHLV